MRQAIALFVAAVAALGQISGSGQAGTPSSTTLVGNVTFLSPTDGWAEVSTSPGYGQFCYQASTPPPTCFRASTTVYGTVDGGQTWRKLLRFSSRPFVGLNNLPSVWMQPDNGGYGFVLVWTPGAHGGPGRGMLYRTSDDGTTWTKLSLPFKPALGYVADTDVATTDGTDLWLLAHQGAAAGSEAVSVYRTRDSGTHWKKVACAGFGLGTNPGGCRLPSGIGVGGHKDDIVFTSSMDGFMVNNNASGVPFLLTTHDGGIHWKVQKVPMPRGLPVPNQTSVFPYVTLSQAHFFGETGVLPASSSLCRGQRVNGRTNYVCTDRFDALVSHDGGRSWPVSRRFPTMSSKQMQSLTWQIASEQVWYAMTGTNLWTTEDGGSNWTAVRAQLPQRFRMLQLDFVSATTGWGIAGKLNPGDGVAGAAKLVHTVDAGKTWSTVSPGSVSL